MNNKKIKTSRRFTAEYAMYLDKDGFLKNASSNIESRINRQLTCMHETGCTDFLNAGLNLGPALENALFSEMSKSKNCKFVHYKADSTHKDITCEGMTDIPETLKEVCQEMKHLYNDNPVFDTFDIYSIEVKTSKVHSSITGNKTTSKNKNVRKLPFSFYLLINYKLTYHDGLPQISEVQVRFCWIDNTEDIWGKSYKTADAVQIRYSTAPDIFIVILDNRKYTKRTEKYRLEVHPRFK